MGPNGFAPRQRHHFIMVMRPLRPVAIVLTASKYLMTTSIMISPTLQDCEVYFDNSLTKDDFLNSLAILRIICDCVEAIASRDRVWVHDHTVHFGLVQRYVVRYLARVAHDLGRHHATSRRIRDVVNDLQACRWIPLVNCELDDGLINNEITGELKHVGAREIVRIAWSANRVLEGLKEMVPA